MPQIDSKLQDVLETQKKNITLLNELSLFIKFSTSQQDLYDIRITQKHLKKCILPKRFFDNQLQQTQTDIANTLLNFKPMSKRETKKFLGNYFSYIVAKHNIDNYNCGLYVDKELEKNLYTRAFVIHNSNIIHIPPTVLQKTENVSDLIDKMSTIAHECGHIYQHKNGIYPLKDNPSFDHGYGFNKEAEFLTQIAGKDYDRLISIIKNINYLRDDEELFSRQFALDQLKDIKENMDKLSNPKNEQNKINLEALEQYCKSIVKNDKNYATIYGKLLTEASNTKSASQPSKITQLNAKLFEYYENLDLSKFDVVDCIATCEMLTSIAGMAGVDKKLFHVLADKIEFNGSFKDLNLIYDLATSRGISDKERVKFLDAIYHKYYSKFKDEKVLHNLSTSLDAMNKCIIAQGKTSFLTSGKIIKQCEQSALAEVVKNTERQENNTTKHTNEPAHSL